MQLGCKPVWSNRDRIPFMEPPTEQQTRMQPTPTQISLAHRRHVVYNKNFIRIYF